LENIYEKNKQIMTELPTVEFVGEIEKKFKVNYPENIKNFCKNCTNHKSANIKIPHGKFITELDELQKINSQIGAEQWSDYEKAITGNIKPKSGNKLWGDILPIFYDVHDI
jgi:ribosomal protein L44E